MVLLGEGYNKKGNREPVSMNLKDFAIPKGKNSSSPIIGGLGWLREVWQESSHYHELFYFVTS